MATDIVRSGTFRLEFPNFGEMGTEITEGIESGSMLIQEVLCVSNPILGEVNSNRFEVTLYNFPYGPGHEIGDEDLTGQKIIVSYREVEAPWAEWQTLFTGYVQSCKQDNLGLYSKIVAYDVWYTRQNDNVANVWNHWFSMPLTTPYYDRDTLLRFLAELLKPIVIDSASRDYAPRIIVPLSRNNPVPNNLTDFKRKDAVRTILAVFGVVGNINREGNFEFVPIHEYTSPMPYIDISNNIERGNTTIENFTTDQPSVVKFVDSSGSTFASLDGSTIAGIKDTGQVYTVVDNLIIRNISGGDYTRLLPELLFRLNKAEYNPFSAQMICSDFDIKLGTRIKIDNMTSIVMSNTISGASLVNQTLIAAGDKTAQSYTSSYNPNYETSANMATLESTVSTLSNEIKSVGDRVTTLEGKIHIQDIVCNNVTITTKYGSVYYGKSIKFSDYNIDPTKILGINMYDWTQLLASVVPYINSATTLGFMSDVSQTVTRINVRIAYMS